MEPEQTYYVLTDAQIEGIIDETVNRTVEGVEATIVPGFEGLASSLASVGESVGGGVVALDGAQYDELSGLISSGVHGSLYVFAALCFIAGLVGIWAVVSNWRDT